MVFVVAGLSSGVAAWAELPPLIPRTILFGNPDKVSPKVSPDGKRLAYLAPDADVLNVWVRTVGRSDDHPITMDRNRGISYYFWSPSGDQILYVQDREGKDNWHLYAVKLDTTEVRDLTPFDDIQARVVATSPAIPNDILVSVNNRLPHAPDVYRVDLTTGRLALEVRNDHGIVGWLADFSLRVRGGITIRGDGGHTLLVRDTPTSKWRKLATWGPQDALTSGPIDFAPDGKGIYVLSSTDSNTSQLRRIDLATGSETTLAHDEQADITQVLVHPLERTIQAVAYSKQRCTWQVLDESIAEDFEVIGGIQCGDLGIINRDHRDQTWLIYFGVDDGPIRYYAYDRATKKAEFLFSNRKSLEGLTLAKMGPIRFKARDGLLIHGYLTAPPGIPPKKLPTILHVHDGPWSRHVWGYDAVAQWLANRGYAVLQLNYRGSKGYGKEYLNAGNREWGGKMQDDLLDGVAWAVKEGIADPKRIAIFGSSYGGYATLAGLAFSPEVFCCGMDISGPSNLVSFMENIPPYWKLFEPILWDRVGHPEKDAELLEARSPLFHVDRITKPLLIAQGGLDLRVRKSETLQLISAIRSSGGTVEYEEYSDERHGIRNPKNLLDFYAGMERFLATHLGGRCEE